MEMVWNIIEVIRERWRRYVRRRSAMSNYSQLMKDLDRVHPGRKFARDEMNAR
jgi:hypothetical protein